jgi:hypothetical protein
MPSRGIHECRCSICVAGANAEVAHLHRQLNLLLSRLTEPQRRWYAGLESQRWGRGGDRQIAQMTGLSENTIRRGRRELEAHLAPCPIGRLRQVGAGRPAADVCDGGLAPALEALLLPETAGNPQGSEKHKRSSLRQLSARLAERGHRASPMTVGRLLRKLGFSLRVNARRKEAKSASPEEREAQFQHIEQQKQGFLAAGDPVISVDTKKKS